MSNTLETYRTQSLYEAAFLVARGFRLAGKERSGSKVTLLFEPHPDLEATVLNFYNGGLVEGKALVDAYRTLKDFIFER